VTRVIQKHAKDFAFVVAIFFVALIVGGGILSKQRLYLPHWVPLVGSDFVDRQLEMSTAQSLTPGQGQEIAIAGVKVGEIAKVELSGGRALVTMKIRRQYADRIREDATALVRPKTGLNDMTIQLDPGTRSAPKAPAKFVIPVDRTLPNVNADEILASLDGDTRDYLRLLLGGAGEGLHNNSRALSNTFRRFEPTGRDLARFTGLLKARRENISHSIHNFRLLTEAVGEKDAQLAKLVDTSNQVFQAFARNDTQLRQTLRLLPGTLHVTRSALGKADRFARALGPATRKLRPFARDLAPAQRASRPAFKIATPIIRDSIRPFTRASLPVVKELRPAARDLATVTPDLTATLSVVNELLNELAYNPPGPAEGYLFYTAWTNHDAMSLFATQDAHGPVRRGNFLVSCSALTTLTAVAQANPALGSVISQVNPPFEACPSQAGAGAGTPPGSSTPPPSTLPSIPPPPVKATK
jgi:phospholipid/cholesterol/gamma-HCH transport system substrate-binding protein